MGITYEIENNRLDVQNGQTLTIAPKVKVDLPASSVNLLVLGELIAEGTATDRIRFVSSATSGGGSLVFDGSAIGGRLRYVDFDQLGDPNQSFYRVGLRIDGSGVQMAHCRFTNIDRPLLAQATAVGQFEANNELDRIDLIGDLGSSSTWPAFRSDGGTYLLVEANLDVVANQTLTIEPGVTVKTDNVNNLRIFGTLQAVGNPTDSIYFTSDGGNDGGSLYFQRDGFGSMLRYVSITRLGNRNSFYRTAIENEANSLRLDSSRLADNPNVAIVNTQGASATFVGNLITHNGLGIKVESGLPTITGNDIIDNALGVVNAANNDTLALCDNWFGDASGPFEATLNPNGQGNEVQGPLKFAPTHCNNVSTQLADAKSAAAFQVFPNPTDGPLHLAWDETNRASPGQRVTVYDAVLGQQLLSHRLQGERSLSLDLSAYPAGLYLLRLDTEHGTHWQRIQKH